ncbi:MAG: NFACT RNA binding domain-containing protein [Chloroherpetonaceae bacterium]|nr:NFACT RNA binding domain-containing protein [Chloroherpetonaceae bacterium]
MIKNYFTLYYLAAEIQDAVQGGFVIDCFTQSKNELRIAFATPSKKDYTIIFNAERADIALYFTRDSARQRRNTTSLFSPLREKELTSLRLADRDRVLSFFFSESLQLQFQLFSADTSCALFQKTGETWELIESFKRKSPDVALPKESKNQSTFISEAFAPLPLEASPSFFAEFESLVQSPEKLEARLRERLDQSTQPFSLAKNSREIFPYFDSFLTKAFIARFGKASLDTASLHTDMPQLAAALESLFDDLLSPAPTVYIEGEASDSPVCHFSLFADSPKEGDTIFTFESVNDALSAYAYHRYRLLHTQKERLNMKKNLERLIKKNESTLQALSTNEQSSRIAKYEAEASLLAMNRSLLKKGMTSVTVQHFEAPFEPVTLKLLPDKCPQENIDLAFLSARKAKEKKAFQEKRRAELAQYLIEQYALLEKLVQMKSSKEFLELKQREASLLTRFGLLSQKEAEETFLFRKFPISGNAELWVGKNAKNNDLLTLRYAKPSDVWLHARGVAGSHCVLKSHRPPSIVEIERAAEIAAYYSTARTSDLVPVIYTEKKYVRKPKGAALGAVTVERENVILVPPKPFGPKSDDDTD